MHETAREDTRNKNAYFVPSVDGQKCSENASMDANLSICFRRKPNIKGES